VESGLMTPSLGTLEKISEALDHPLNRFFARGSQVLLDDPFIQELHPFLRQLDLEQWQWIVQRLAAISEGVVIEPAALARSRASVDSPGTK